MTEQKDAIKAAAKAKALAKAKAAEKSAATTSSKKSRVKKAGKQNKGEQKFSFGVAMVTLALILGYFIQSGVEIAKQEPIKIAIERISSDKSSQKVTDDSKKSVNN